MLQVFYKWCASQITPRPTLQEEMQKEAEWLHRDTIKRNLRLIDDRYKIAANRAKARMLLELIKS